MDLFQKWRHFLQGTLYHVIVYAYHKNLEYFMYVRVLNCRQALWNMSLSHFDFVITYQPRKQQGLLDALSQRSYLAPKEGVATYDHQRTTLIKAERFRLRATRMSMHVDSSFLDQVHI